MSATKEETKTLPTGIVFSPLSGIKTARHFPTGKGTVLGAIDALHQEVYKFLRGVPVTKKSDEDTINGFKKEAEELLKQIQNMIICCSDIDGTVTVLDGRTSQYLNNANGLTNPEAIQDAASTATTDRVKRDLARAEENKRLYNQRCGESTLPKALLNLLDAEPELAKIFAVIVSGMSNTLNRLLKFRGLTTSDREAIEKLNRGPFTAVDFSIIDKLAAHAEKSDDKELKEFANNVDKIKTALIRQDYCILLNNLIAEKTVLLSLMSLSDFDHIDSVAQHGGLQSAAILSGKTASSNANNRAEVRVQQVRKTLKMVLLMLKGLENIIKALSKVLDKSKNYYNSNTNNATFFNNSELPVQWQIYYNARDDIREELGYDFLTKYYAACRDLFRPNDSVEWDNESLVMLRQLRGVLFIDDSRNNQAAVKADLTKLKIPYISITPSPNQRAPGLVPLIKKELTNMNWLSDNLEQNQAMQSAPIASSSR